MNNLWRSVCVVLLLPFSAMAQQPTRPHPEAPPLFALRYLCSGLSGAVLTPPDWKSEPDRAADQLVVLGYSGDNQVAGAAWTLGNAQSRYYEAVGFGRARRTGFSIVAWTDTDVETYVYNASTRELLYSSIRVGSGFVPNSIKSFRGACKPVVP